MSSRIPPKTGIRCRSAIRACPMIHAREKDPDHRRPESGHSKPGGSQGFPHQDRVRPGYQSNLIPPALMTPAHLVVSLWMKAANSLGVLATTSAPSAEM